MRRLGALMLGVVLTACGGGGDGGGGGAPRALPNPADTPAGCEPARTATIEGTAHISPPQKVAYKTNPPTSGQHYSAAGVGPAAPGVYTDAPPDEGLVHNLEHGHVILWHAPDLPRTQLDALTSIVQRDRRFRLLVPRASMPYKVAFTSWGIIQGCATPTGEIAAAAEAFVKRFQQKAPENVPGRPLG